MLRRYTCDSILQCTYLVWPNRPFEFQHLTFTRHRSIFGNFTKFSPKSPILKVFFQPVALFKRMNFSHFLSYEAPHMLRRYANCSIWQRIQLVWPSRQFEFQHLTFTRHMPIFGNFKKLHQKSPVLKVFFQASCTFQTHESQSLFVVGNS